MASDANSESTGSDSGSTPEEERIRRLFQTCDGNGDGYIDSHDLLAVCRQLNLEHCVEEIMVELGADEQGRISYSEFLRRRMQLMNEINALTLHDQERDDLEHHHHHRHRHHQEQQDQNHQRSGRGGISRGSSAGEDGGDADEDPEGTTPLQVSPAPGSTSTGGNWQMSSDTSQGAISGKHESWEFDSGARDLSPEPNTLHKLIEATGASVPGKSSDLLDLANKLHLAALSSLKGEIMELTNRLQHIIQERDLLERQLNRSQLDRLLVVREHEDRMEQQALRYEERLTELHSIIAELSKKLEIQRANIIKEEDEFSQQSGDESRQSEAQSHCTSNDNNLADSSSDKGDSNCDSNPELSAKAHGANRDQEDLSSGLGDNESFEEKAMLHEGGGHSGLGLSHGGGNESGGEEYHPLTGSMMMTTENRATSCHSLQISQMQEEAVLLRAETSGLQEQLGQHVAELNRMRMAFGSCRDERDRLQRRCRELQTKVNGLQQPLSQPSSQGSQAGSSPTRSKSPHINPTTGERTPTSSSTTRVGGGQGLDDSLPIAKLAERVRLKKTLELNSSGGVVERHHQISGPEIACLGVSTTKVAEHMVHSMQEESHAQEIFQTLYSSGSSVPETKIREFEVEMERLNSRIENLKSQNDLLNLTLDESKSQCDRLSVLIGKYESNNTALQLALTYSDQSIETFEVLLALLESEQGLILANCRAAGLGGLVSASAPSSSGGAHKGVLTSGGAGGGVGAGQGLVVTDNNKRRDDGAGDAGEDENGDEVTVMLKRAQDNRKVAENVARHCLQKLDRTYGIAFLVPGCNISPWEDVSSHSRTTSTTSSTSSSTEGNEFTKMDEQRLRDYITQLRGDRCSVKTTVVELESVHVDPSMYRGGESANSVLDAQKLDLENAVLMQELMAMKEEKAELKAQVYLLEKEKASLELRLNSREAQEQAYLVHIEHLKAEVEEQQQMADRLRGGTTNNSQGQSSGSLVWMSEGSASPDSGHELAEAERKEKKLKTRIQDLVSTLEKVTKNSELRAQQSTEFINDLKRANSALVTAFEKAKKKNQTKMKKLEQQMALMLERHNAQVRMLKQRIAMLEESENHQTSNFGGETSL